MEPSAPRDDDLDLLAGGSATIDRPPSPARSTSVLGRPPIDGTHELVEWCRQMVDLALGCPATED
jgi:hypothetical protein